tara:strand:- start:1265 stop:2068 length:804 start_codon:yes stop_codon:yes gene_type:complete
MAECNICNDDVGWKFCECNFLICDDCLDKIKDYKCPQCKVSMKKNYFFAGKILNYEEIDSESYYNTHQNRIVVAEEEDIDQISYHKFGNIDKKLIMSKKDYTNLSISIKAELPTYNLVGPCAILNNKKKEELYHGMWYDNYLSKDITNISNIVIERNDQMINSCDIFSLKIPKNLDCFKSFSEWGQAKVLDKILIIFGSLTDELYLFCQESIDSFQKIGYERRNPIIFNHPELPFKTYREYKKSLIKIIEKRKKMYEVLSCSEDDSD